MSDNTKQLYKKSSDGSYPKIFPLAFIQGIKDKRNDKELLSYINEINHFKVDYIENPETTRCQIDNFIRKKGLYITYYNTDINENVTEYFKGNQSDVTDDNIWGNSDNWELVPDKTYIESHAVIPDRSINMNKLADDVIQAIGDSGLSADEEDLTDRNGILKFKDREYNIEDASGLGYKILRKNWVEDKNILTQDMINEANTIYEIRYDFDLAEETIVIPSNCVLKFDGGSLNNGVVSLQNTKTIGFPNFDLNVIGTIKTSEVYQEWFGDIDKFLYFLTNTTGYSVVNFKEGEYYPTIVSTIKASKSVIINGNGCKLLYDYSDTGGSTVLLVKPIDDAITEYTIPVAIAKDMMTFTVSDATGLNVGDVVAIRDKAASSFSWYRNYQKGEFAIITKIESNTITINRNLSDSYEHIGYLYLYKFNIIDVKINNLSIIQTTLQDASSLGIRLLQTSANLNNVCVSGFELNYYLRYNYNSTITDCVGLSSDMIPSDNRVSYGILIGNSQGVKVIGGIYKAKNHGISIGGTYDENLDIINRFHIIDGVNAANVEDGFLGSIETHGDAQYCTFRNNWCNGIYFAGKDILVTSNHIYFLGGVELANFNHVIQNNIIYGYFYIIMSRMTLVDGQPKYAGSTYDNFIRETKTNILTFSNNVVLKETNPYYVYDSVSSSIRCDVDDSIFDANLLQVNMFNNVLHDKLQIKLFNINGIEAPENHDYSDFQKGGNITFKNNDIGVVSEIATYHIFAGKNINLYNNNIDDIISYSFYCCELNIEKNNIKIVSAASFSYRVLAAELINIINNKINVSKLSAILTISAINNPNCIVNIINNIIETSVDRLFSLSATLNLELCFAKNSIIPQIVGTSVLLLFRGTYTNTITGVINDNTDYYNNNFVISNNLQSLVPV